MNRIFTLSIALLGTINSNAQIAAKTDSQVKIDYFNSTVKSNHTVFSNWVTEQETNHGYFELERSFNNKEFNTVAYILGAKSSDGATNVYEYNDKTQELATQKVAYYRLKATDKAGSVNYSEVRSVNLETTCEKPVSVAPNPFQDKVSVKFSAEQATTASVKIFSVTGQVVYQSNKNISKGFNNISLDNLSSIKPGMYILQVMTNGQVISKEKLVKY